MRIQLSHATVKELQSSLDDPVDFPVRPTHPSTETDIPRATFLTAAPPLAANWERGSRLPHQSTNIPISVTTHVLQQDRHVACCPSVGRHHRASPETEECCLYASTPFNCS